MSVLLVPFGFSGFNNWIGAGRFTGCLVGSGLHSGISGGKGAGAAAIGGSCAGCRVKLRSLFKRFFSLICIVHASVIGGCFVALEIGV